MWKFWTFVDDLFVCMIDFQNNSFGCIIVEKSKILVVFIYLFLDWCSYVCWKCVVIFCWVLGINVLCSHPYFFLELCGICYHINFDCLFLKSFCINFIVSFSRHRYFHFSLPTFIYLLEWKDWKISLVHFYNEPHVITTLHHCNQIGKLRHKKNAHWKIGIVQLPAENSWILGDSDYLCWTPALMSVDPPSIFSLILQSNFLMVVCLLTYILSWYYDLISFSYQASWLTWSSLYYFRQCLLECKASPYSVVCDCCVV